MVSWFADCWQQCDRNFQRTADSWWYTSVKNKAKLHTGHERRREAKKARSQRVQMKQAADSTDPQSTADSPEPEDPRFQ